MCCGTVSRNHKLKLVVTAKAKKTMIIQGYKLHSCPYYNQKRSWIDSKISENCFHKHFVPEVQTFLKERGLPQKAVLFLDNALLIQERVY
jgi:hypothetical protein